MSVYPSSPIGRNVLQAVPGLPVYLLGSLNRTVPDTRMTISTVALSGTTATVVGTVIEGQIPVAGQLVSIAGAVPAYFNVTNAKILSVSAAASPDLGVYTITFTLVNSGIATTNSPGIAVAPQIEVGDSCTLGDVNGGPWSSAECSIQENVNPANGKALRADVSFPVLPGAAIVTVQTAVYDIDSEYKDLATVATVTGGVLAGGSVIVANVEAVFVRFHLTGLAAAGAGKVVGKITI